MKEQSFALVTGIGAEWPVASQLPLEIVEDDGSLFFTGHLMRKTDHHLAFEKNENVLVIFTSPHAYIDASWYGNPAEASTVNYMAVHAKGKISFSDEAGTLEAIKKITHKHIAADACAAFDKIPDAYIQASIKAIVGFKIAITSLQHVFKLSQNKSAAVQQSIIEHLEKRNEPGSSFIAAKMKTLLKEKI